MHSLISTSRRHPPRDLARFDAVSESVQSWVLGDAVGADVCNAVIDAIASDPRPETVTVATAVLPSSLRDDVIDYLASLRGAKVESLFRIASACGGEERPDAPPPLDERTIEAISRWFDER